MIKYIKEEWPEYQIFMEHPRFEKDCYYCTDDNSYFIPEDLYMEVMYPPFKLPKEYEENFTTEFTRIKRNQKVLVKIKDTQELKIDESEVSWSLYRHFPVIFKDKSLIDGLNCDIVAVEKHVDS